jgi:hypothetical protein
MTVHDSKTHWLTRSLKPLSLVLFLTTALPIALTAQEAFAQNNQPLTWTQFFERMFSRRKDRGGTREPILPTVPEIKLCAVTPTDLKSPPDRKPIPTDSPSFVKPYFGPLLTEKPLIAWYGDVRRIELNTINRPVKESWQMDIDLPPTSIENPTINQIQYNGAALHPNQDYELILRPKDSRKPSVRQYFTTLSQPERNLTNRQLKQLAIKPSTEAYRERSQPSDPRDPLLKQVEYLLEQNLVNDAQALILQAKNPSAELKATLTSLPDPCLKKAEPKKRTEEKKN